MHRADAWYATVEHYRAWLFADGGFWRDFQAINKFTPELVRRMARHYSVARTIPSVSPSNDGDEDMDANENRKIVADELNSMASRWPDDLKARADQVIESAQSIRTRIGAGNPPYSALSKFIWFAHGKGWTLYDSLASAGMLPDGGTSEERVRAFYAALGPCLPCLSAELQPICDESGLTLHAEKIIDIFLMLRGARRVRSGFAEDIVAGCDHFIALLPRDIAQRLDHCAVRISISLTSDALPRPLRVSWRKREVTY